MTSEKTFAIRLSCERRDTPWLGSILNQNVSFDENLLYWLATLDIGKDLQTRLNRLSFYAVEINGERQFNL